MGQTFGERLQAALTAAAKTRGDLCKVLKSTDGSFGISESALGQVINGSSKSLNAENTARAARFLQVDSYWLATGEGAMRPPAHRVAEAPGLYVTESQLLDRFGRWLQTLPAELRAPIAGLLASWASSGGDDRHKNALVALLAPEPSKQRATGT